MTEIINTVIRPDIFVSWFSDTEEATANVDFQNTITLNQTLAENNVIVMNLDQTNPLIRIITVTVNDVTAFLSAHNAQTLEEITSSVNPAVSNYNNLHVITSTFTIQ